jgi:hypothetical protein
MLADRLIDAGYKTFAVDGRIDKVPDDPKINPAKNVDHGWFTPITQKFFESLFKAYPDRQFAVIGCSLGVTVIRDALRRMHIEHVKNGGINPWKQLKQAIFLAGGNHGVSTYTKLCGKDNTMRSKAACQFGDRNAYSPVEFMKPLNGPEGIYETPCSDGNSAYGATCVCGDNTVKYTTIVMKDIEEGSQQDEFVSEASSHLKGAENLTIGLNDFDETEYIAEFLKNHVGSCRSKAALDLALKKLQE